MSKLIVKSQRDGYRRSGISFTRAGVIVDPEAHKLTTEQVEAIKTDARLLVADYVEPAAGSTEAKPGSKGSK